VVQFIVGKIFPEGHESKQCFRTCLLQTLIPTHHKSANWCSLFRTHLIKLASNTGAVGFQLYHPQNEIHTMPFGEHLCNSRKQDGTKPSTAVRKHLEDDLDQAETKLGESPRIVAITKIVIKRTNSLVTRVQRPFDANGIGKQRFELSEQLQDRSINVAFLSESHLKPHERLPIPNYHVYRTDRFQCWSGGTAVAVRKGISHHHSDLPPIVLIGATRICVPVGNSEVLIAAVHKPPGRACSDANVIDLLSLRTKSLLAGELNAKNRV